MTLPLASDLELRFSGALDVLTVAEPSDFGAAAVSAGSSNVVAEVEYESCAEELLLWGGDPTLVWPSEIRTLLIDLPSPLPLRRLGVLGEYVF